MTAFDDPRSRTEPLRLCCFYRRSLQCWFSSTIQWRNYLNNRHIYYCRRCVMHRRLKWLKAYTEQSNSNKRKPIILRKLCTYEKLWNFCVPPGILYITFLQWIVLLFHRLECTFVLFPSITSIVFRYFLFLQCSKFCMFTVDGTEWSSCVPMRR